MFDANKAVDHIVKWIQDWFEVNGKGCNAVIGISGGKDSTITAALLVKALGKDRVYGIMMPTFWDKETEAISEKIYKFLEIKCYTIAIKSVVNDLSIRTNIALKSPVSVITSYDQLTDGQLTEQTKINLPARIRMATLYAVSQSVNGRVANTCNLSEDWVGYSTRYGDSVGDFSPLSNYTVTEVRQIGKALGLPDEFVYRVPSDGLCGKTDEDNLGFTYEVLDRYIRTGECENKDIKAKIDELHERNKFKLELMQSCPYYVQE